jgi:hypothetical protein
MEEPKDMQEITCRCGASILQVQGLDGKFVFLDADPILTYKKVIEGYVKPTLAYTVHFCHSRNFIIKTNPLPWVCAVAGSLVSLIAGWALRGAFTL